MMKNLGLARRAGLLLSCGCIAAVTACSAGANPGGAPLPITGDEVTSSTSTTDVPSSTDAPQSADIPTSSRSGITTKPRSVTNAKPKLLATGADPATNDDAGTKTDNTKQFPIGQLKQPDLVRLLPPGLPQVGANAATGQIATPVAKLTAAYASPTDAGPILALNQDTDMMLNMDAHWAVVGQKDGWVEILTPVGRGSMPSKDPTQVNHHAVWVKASDVTLAPAQYKIEVSTSDYTMTVTGPKGSNTFHIGVGKVGQTETPKGLCAIVGKITIQTGEPGYLTNCQSEMLDQFDGAADAATAIHEYDPLGFDPATGGAVSNGCMRIPNDAFEKYLQDIPAGTPVVIH